ncbi:(2Fe-2S)-binding protein [Boseaceae bacterium BT-24-1]|nr:(2Fe-2S)-binding protein [Boseaceae bacterium BT-24-1]
MFRPISDELRQATSHDGSPSVRAVGFTFDGRRMTARAGDTVAAALLVNGVAACRETPVSAARRGPYCLMGVCFDCLVVIDGVGNRQACLTPLREGMAVETQHGARDIGALERDE